MNAGKTIKVLSLVLYFLYLVFFSMESQARRIRHASRAPASFTAGEEESSLPLEKRVWIQNVLTEDNAGILEGVKGNLGDWQESEEYREKWGIGSSGLYDTPDRREKSKYLRKTLLKYADKRLSGELKEAEAGSALHRIKTAEKALSPKVEAGLTKNIKIKFKARVLQRTGKLIVKNPLLDSHVKIDTSGRVNIHLSKNLKNLGLVAKVNYGLRGDFRAEVDKKLSRHISSTISSSRDKNAPFGGPSSDNQLRISYRSRFP